MNPTTIAQYGNSPTINAIQDTFDEADDVSAMLAEFFAWRWDIATAGVYGLNALGRVTGVLRSDLTDIDGNVIDLTDDEYRQIILTRVMCNIYGSYVPTINQILNFLYEGTSGAYVQDNLDMTLTYILTFVPTTAQLAALIYFAKNLRPTGVNAFAQTNSSRFFGFAEQQSSPTDATIGNFSALSNNGAPFFPLFSVL